MKILFYRFLHFKIFNLNKLLKNKIEPIGPKLDFSIFGNDENFNTLLIGLF